MLTSSEIKHIAELARLRLSAEEIEGLGADLAAMLDYVRVLDRIEVEAGEGAQSASLTSPSATRADAATSSLDAASFLANAPESLDRFLLVPAIK